MGSCYIRSHLKLVHHSHSFSRPLSIGHRAVSANSVCNFRLDWLSRSIPTNAYWMTTTTVNLVTTSSLSHKVPPYPANFFIWTCYILSFTATLNNVWNNGCNELYSTVGTGFFFSEYIFFSLICNNILLAVVPGRSRYKWLSLSIRKISQKNIS